MQPCCETSCKCAVIRTTREQLTMRPCCETSCKCAVIRTTSEQLTMQPCCEACSEIRCSHYRLVSSPSLKRFTLREASGNLHYCTLRTFISNVCRTPENLLSTSIQNSLLYSAVKDQTTKAYFLFHLHLFKRSSHKSIFQELNCC